MHKLLHDPRCILACQWSIRFLCMVCSLGWRNKTRGSVATSSCLYAGCIVGSAGYHHSPHYSHYELRYISLGEWYWHLFDRFSLHLVECSPTYMLAFSGHNLHPDLFWVCLSVTIRSQFLCFRHYSFESDNNAFWVFEITVTVIATKLAPWMHQF